MVLGGYRWILVVLSFFIGLVVYDGSRLFLVVFGGSWCSFLILFDNFLIIS